MALLDRLVVPDAHVLEENYVVLMETHLDYLRTHPRTHRIETTGQQAAKYIGDLNGLLDSLAIGKKYQYLVVRLNGYLCSNEYDGTQLEFLIPDITEVAQFLGIYTSIED